MIPSVIPTDWNIWKTIIVRTPTHISVPRRSADFFAVLQHLHMTTPNQPKITKAPINPSSSPTTEKRKSVCCSGTNSPRVC